MPLAPLCFVFIPKIIFPSLCQFIVLCKPEKNLRAMKMSKKSRKVKVPVIPKDQPVKLVLVTDTTCLGLGKTSWEGVYNLLEA